MKPALLKKYFATFRDVKEKLMQGGALTSIEADAMRDELCLKAHGRVISAAAMTDDEAADVLKEFALILQPDNLNAQLEDNSTEGRKRAQCLWSINQEEKHPGYAAALSQDLYGRRDFASLPYEDLLQLRRRIGNDARGYVIPGGNGGRGQRAAASGRTTAVSGQRSAASSSRVTAEVDLDAIPF